MSSVVEQGGRSYGRRALVGIAPGPGPDGMVRAFAPFRLSTYKALEAKDLDLAARYIGINAGDVQWALEARGADISQTDWSIQTPDELIKTGGTP